MKINQIFIACGFVLLSIQGITGTIITSTLLTGFMGGFLMGKITLGTFLAVLNAFNQRPVTGPASVAVTQSPTKVATRNNYGDFEFFDIPNSVETEVRDRFLRQLGKMDPLNCLPKVFCEISSDPKSASTIFKNGGLLGLNSGIQSTITKMKTKNKKKSLKKKQTANNDEIQDDTGDDDEENSDSHSDEEEEDDETKRMKEYEARDKYKLESKALEEMIDEYDEPVNYYFILKDKKKNVHPELLHMMKTEDFEKRRSFSRNPSNGVIGKKMGNTEEIRSESIDDVFDKDPFFDDFSRSLKFPKESSERRGSMINIGLLRRNRREAFASDEEDITMGKYKMAAQVAEMRDPKKCRRVFNTCPFSAEEVMNMISTMNSNDEKNAETYSTTYKITKKNKNKKIKQDGSMTNLKNTLVAIEKLNDATLLAETMGEPVDYTKVIQDAFKSHVSGGSAKILEDLEEIEDQLSPSRLKKRNNKTKSGKTKKSKKTIRRRRHGEDPRVVHMSPKKFERRARISTPGRGKLQLPGDRDDEFLTQANDRVSMRAQIFSEEESRESSVSEEIKLPNVYLAEPLKYPEEIPVVKKMSQKEPELRKVDMGDEVEDDEVSSPEAEEPVSVPTLTFSQSFIDTLGAPSKIKSKPRPVHHVVKVKPQTLQRSTSPKPVTSVSTSKPRRPTTSSSVKQKFSGELEDDEEEAKNSEKEIDEIVSKYKHKG